jgi:hypothetical protein
VNKQFVKAHADFLGAAAALGSATGATRDGASTGSGPEALSDRASEMSRLEDLLDLLAALPKTIQSLEAFKPRPTGAIQRRVNSMLFTVESAIKSPTRDEATKQLAELTELSDLADQLSSQTVATLSPAVAQGYTGDQLAGLETKWKSMVMEMAGAFCIRQAQSPQSRARIARGARARRGHGSGIRSTRGSGQMGRLDDHAPADANAHGTLSAGNVAGVRRVHFRES